MQARGLEIDFRAAVSLRFRIWGCFSAAGGGEPGVGCNLSRAIARFISAGAHTYTRYAWVCMCAKKTTNTHPPYIIIINIYYFTFFYFLMSFFLEPNGFLIVLRFVNNYRITRIIPTAVTVFVLRTISFCY